MLILAVLNLIILLSTLNYYKTLNVYFINVIGFFACLHSLINQRRWRIWIRIGFAAGMLAWSMFDLSKRIPDLKIKGVDEDGQTIKFPTYEGNAGIWSVHLISIMLSITWDILLVVDGYLTYKQRLKAPVNMEMEMEGSEEAEYSKQNKSYLQQYQHATAGETSFSDAR
ncbi:hypothetical protein BGX28_004938 [Mortierella sp. GBA30]|nr:hypothetical protein BGX28_004938 [Mortierella sp. GBA30]